MTQDENIVFSPSREKTPVGLYRQAGTRWLLCRSAGSHCPEHPLKQSQMHFAAATFRTVICGHGLCRKSRSVQFWHRQSCLGVRVVSRVAPPRPSTAHRPYFAASQLLDALRAAEKGNLPERCQACVAPRRPVSSSGLLPRWFSRPPGAFSPTPREPEDDTPHQTVGSGC